VFEGRWSVEIKSGYVVKVDGNKYLIGFGEFYQTYKSNGRNYFKNDKNGKPLTFKERHPYLPSFYRDDRDCWEICEYGCWIDRCDFYKLGGFTHLNRLIVKTKKEIDSNSTKIESDKERLKELEGELEKLKIVEKHLEVV
jgi:hypothetical protein